MIELFNPFDNVVSNTSSRIENNMSTICSHIYYAIEEVQHCTKALLSLAEEPICNYFRLEVLTSPEHLVAFHPSRTAPDTLSVSYLVLGTTGVNGLNGVLAWVRVSGTSASV